MKNAVRNAPKKKAEKKHKYALGRRHAVGQREGGGGFILRMNSLRRVHAELCKASSTPRRPSAKGGGFQAYGSCRPPY